MSTPVTQKDGLQLLVKDHEEFFDFFKRIESAKGQDKKKLVDSMIREISKHASCEERYVYPLFRKWLQNGSIIADRNITDDQVNKELMELLERMQPERDGELYDLTVKKFIMVESEHLKQEEVWIDELRTCLSNNELSDLYDTLIEAKLNAPLHPHSWAPSKPSTGANILHPLAGKLDRFVERVTGQ